MYEYIIGEVKDIEGTTIILENNKIGYIIYTPNPFSFELNKEYKVYLYHQIKEDEQLFFGFTKKEEKDFFLKLISVKGLGPKMALPILATGSLNGIMDAIERENLLYLKKFPKIGDKLAKQIILDLKGKIDLTGVQADNKDIKLDEVKDALLGLGYKEKEIRSVLAKIDVSLSVEEQIKMALKLFMK